ncbi:MAG: triose-phosphate isomerase [Planctomycetes bacterium]|nr:triose-phosphate isomerase [Planctomycetota bacterium]
MSATSPGLDLDARALGRRSLRRDARGPRSAARYSLHFHPPPKALPVRKPFIAGNWKMNLERKTALALVHQLRDHLANRDTVDVAVFPPFVYVEEIARTLKGTKIAVGAQNCCDEPHGAFTGEISAAQLVDVGATHVLLGHSERRHVYGESDALVNRKVHAALDKGLAVILCVGETLEQRQGKQTEKVIGAQLTLGLQGISARDLLKITIAYEPVWAIGTGKVATSKQAGEAHAYLRGVLGGLFTESLADQTRIQYGGSVKPDNVKELLAVRDVDGALVGGASLKAETFLPLLGGR